MTNAEKYLKDGVDDRDFAKALSNYISDGGREITDKEDIRIETLYFLIDEVKPILSEDEKVILRNTDKNIYTIIGFDVHGLYLRSDDDNSSKEYSFYDMFNSLFQFICDGEEYKISDLLEE